MSCLFCKMVAGEIPTKVVLDEEEIFAFRDINPQAPTHILVIPKRHIRSLGEMDAADAELLGRVLHAGRRIAEAEGIAEPGFRCVFNTNDDGGQTVHHVHMHLMGGRPFTWPPG